VRRDDARLVGPDGIPSLSVVGTILCTQLTKGPDAVVINMVDSHMDDDRHMDDDSRNRRSTRADSFCG
jgi:hypothetical protein